MNDDHPQSVIEMHDSWFAYNGPFVLENVNLSIPSRDFVCVIGPNGGGKTTLLKLIVGLLTPTKGKIRVLGRTPVTAARRIGYMPQHAHLDPQFPVSVSDVVIMGRLGQGRRFGPYNRQDRRIVNDTLREVGLEGTGPRPFASLSGGQRQRALIARALACEPELLLLDEPTAGLDPAVQEDLYALLKSLNEPKRGRTIVMVSHDVGFVSTHFRTAVCVNRSVHVHSTGELTGKTVADMYGRPVRLVHPGGGGSS